MGIMRRKKKPKKFRAVEAVKAMARERIGTPKASQIVVGRKKKEEKHKPTLGELLDDQ
jgi:hypothetical protein